MISILLFGLIAAESMVAVRARMSVPGSHQRYVALTQRRIISWSVNIGFAVQGVWGVIAGDSFSFLSLLFAVYLSYIEIKNHRNDDDWFNRRGKKIRSGLKRRREARRARRAARPVRQPVGSPSPSPAFG